LDHGAAWPGRDTLLVANKIDLGVRLAPLQFTLFAVLLGCAAAALASGWRATRARAV